VCEIVSIDREPCSPADRIHRLEAEPRQPAEQHVQGPEGVLKAAALQVVQIAEGGDP
jgi:hypothetical protein